MDKPDTQEQTVLAVTADRRYYVNGIQVSETEAWMRIRFALEEKREKIVYLKGDTDAPYAAIMSMMDKLREAHIENVGLITESKKKAGEEGGD